MGEVPFLCTDDLRESAANGLNLISRGAEATIVLGNKKYVIGGSDGVWANYIEVKIFDESSGKWENPKVFGTKPTPGTDYSAVLFDSNRILVIKNDANIDDPIWFLEVGTEFVRRQSEVLGTDVVAWSKGVCGYAGKPAVISGPSGVGKGTLISKLMKDFPDTFGFSVSHTTRAPREKEVNGVHYHFTDRSTMETDIAEGMFLETAEVHGNLYGTSIEAVETVADAGKRCILDIDVQGARSVRASSLEVVFIFICPPSLDVLKKRLLARGTETEVQYLKRLGNATGEIEQGKSSGIFDHILVNDNLEACYERLKEILGLNGPVRYSRQPAKDACLPLIHSVSKVDQRIYLNCGAVDETMSKNGYILDLTSLKGGAPGRTRGLELLPVNPLVDFIPVIKLSG